MAKYLGPKDKLSRRFGELLTGMPPFEIAKRPYKAGQHGQRKSKVSEYGILLREKQKLRFSYGVIMERQFRRYYQKAVRKNGPTGEILLQMLECRLDTLVYRLGFAASIPAARQLVVHGHILVNGFKENKPSFPVKAGDTISIAEKSRKIPAVVEAMKNWVDVLPYIKREKGSFSGQLTEVPARELIPTPVNERMVVEFYSR
jgi:small subunit ribosomal protein S4